jgi:hypothetical protein
MRTRSPTAKAVCVLDRFVVKVSEPVPTVFDVLLVKPA